MKNNNLALLSLHVLTNILFGFNLSCTKYLKIIFQLDEQCAKFPRE